MCPCLRPCLDLCLRVSATFACLAERAPASGRSSRPCWQHRWAGRRPGNFWLSRASWRAVPLARWAEGSRSVWRVPTRPTGPGREVDPVAFGAAARRSPPTRERGHQQNERPGRNDSPLHHGHGRWSAVPMHPLADRNGIATPADSRADGAPASHRAAYQIRKVRRPPGAPPRGLLPCSAAPFRIGSLRARVQTRPSQRGSGSDDKPRAPGSRRAQARCVPCRASSAGCRIPRRGSTSCQIATVAAAWTSSNSSTAAGADGSSGRFLFVRHHRRKEGGEGGEGEGEP